MFSNPRFMNGAGSTNTADVFCFAAAQVKKALDLTVKLGGKGCVFWGGRVDAFVDERYASFQTGIGKRIVDGNTSLTELAKFAEDMGTPELPASGRQEYLQRVVNEILFR